MSDQIINKNKMDDIAAIHIVYASGLLVEGIRNFHEDMLHNCKCAPDIMKMHTYLRVLELAEKLEMAALIDRRFF